MLKFSIVTISLNQAQFLERAILSVLSQKGVDFEYIVVDPGSTDGSREIIERYRPSFSHVVYENDIGPADGLNKGFARATGDVYCYLNSDDAFELGALLRAAQFLDERSEFDVICGHAWVTDRHDNRLRRVWSEPFRPLFVAYGAATQIQPSTFIRRDAFIKAGGFNRANRSSWDGELLVDLFISGARIGIIDEFLQFVSPARREHHQQRLAVGADATGERNSLSPFDGPHETAVRYSRRRLLSPCETSASTTGRMGADRPRACLQTRRRLAKPSWRQATNVISRWKRTSSPRMERRAAIARSPLEISPRVCEGCSWLAQYV